MPNYKKLSRIQLIRELEKRDRRIEREDSLWKTREGRENRHGDPGSAFRREALREILDDPDDIHSMTGSTAEEFDWILARLTKYVREHEHEMRLGRTGGGGRARIRQQVRPRSGVRAAARPDAQEAQPDPGVTGRHVRHRPEQRVPLPGRHRYRAGRDPPHRKHVGDGIADGTIDSEKAVPEGAALLDGCETPAQRPSEPKAGRRPIRERRRGTRATRCSPPPWPGSSPA